MATIYFDHAATTPLAPEALTAMMPYLKEDFANASSVHAKGRDARSALDRARSEIAETLGADPKQIVFTSGGTESVNAVLKGLAWAKRGSGSHFVVSAVEHACVADCMEWLIQNGCQVTFVPVDSEGRVDPREIEKSIRKETLLVSVMTANNEVGTIQPIQEIAQIAHSKEILFHTDAVQAYGKMPLSVKDGFDLMTVSAHKFYGPKGMGFLYQRKGVDLTPLIHGGGQERGRRGGTENVAGIVGMAGAAIKCSSLMSETTIRLRELEEILLNGMKKRLPEIKQNGPIDPARRVPGLLNLTIPGIESDGLVHSLDSKGFAVSSGPACASGATGTSRTLLAMGRNKTEAREGLRISLGISNTEAEVRQLVEVLPLVADRLRMLSPLLGD